MYARHVVHAVEHHLAGGVVPVPALGEHVGSGSGRAAAFGYPFLRLTSAAMRPEQADRREEQRREQRRPHGEVELQVAEAAGHALDALQVQREPEQPVEEGDRRGQRKNLLGDSLAERGADRRGDHRRRDPDGRPHQALVEAAAQVLEVRLAAGQDGEDRRGERQRSLKAPVADVDGERGDSASGPLAAFELDAAVGAPARARLAAPRAIAARATLGPQQAGEQPDDAHHAGQQRREDRRTHDHVVLAELPAAGQPADAAQVEDEAHHAVDQRHQRQQREHPRARRGLTSAHSAATIVGGVSPTGVHMSQWENAPRRCCA